MAQRKVANPVHLQSAGRALDGRSVLSGERAPLMTDGRTGEFWIDRRVPVTLYGPKTAAGWATGISLTGAPGWTPSLAAVTDSGRRVHRIVDWTGGEGAKPATGLYVGATGLVADIADAVDVRGQPGAAEVAVEDSTFIGGEGEITVDLDGYLIRVHDGVTPGGIPLVPATRLPRPAKPTVLSPASTTSVVPTISGTADPGATVEVKIDTGASQFATADQDGDWSAIPLQQTFGDHVVNARQAVHATAFSQWDRFSMSVDNPVDALLATLQAEGILAKLDALYVTDNLSEETSLLNRVADSYHLTKSGTVTWDAGYGFKSDGSTGYLDTGYNTNTAAGALGLNSGHIGFYSLSEKREIAVDFGSTSVHLSAGYGTDSNILAKFHEVAASYAGGTQIRSLGHFMMTRQNTSSYRVLDNGVLVEAKSIAPVAAADDNVRAFIWGAGGYVSNKRIPAMHFGAHLSDAEALILKTAIEDHLLALSLGWDVFMIAGQSNTLWAQSFDYSLDAGDERVWARRTDGTYSVAETGLDHFYKGTDRIGFGLHFAKSHYADAHLSTGRRVLLVPCGMASSSFDAGDWTAGTGTYWTQSVARANAAMALPGARFRGILWHQGENDVGAGAAAVAAYADRLDPALTGFRAAITGAAGCPIVVGGLADDFINYHGSNAEALQAIIEDTPNRLPNCAYASSAGLATSDLTHFTAAAQRIFAGRYYGGWASLS